MFKCPVCGSVLGVNFTDSERICGGKNEKCGNCGAISWIECETKFALLPIIMLATK